ncbi:Transcription initiation factor IID, subunit [Aphelenchoides bicaudatus]|nr:Transcription initiation factor IID, subunit [Aphelenchoides bicaudatus]
MMTDEPSMFEESEDEEEQKKNPDERKRLFRRELAAMLYGFGDKKEPNEDTLEALEKIVLYYIEQFCTKTLNVGKPNRVGLDDIYYLIRRDQKKYARVKELLSMSEELKKARKVFEDAKELD